MTDTVLHGISNCDSVRKARRWLDEKGRDYRFRDFRKDAPSLSEIRRWAEAAGWETLLNKRGQTWRGLDPARREGLDADGAAALMAAHPLLIKRPVAEQGEQILVGFDAARYEEVDLGS